VLLGCRIEVIHIPGVLIINEGRRIESWIVVVTAARTSVVSTGIRTGARTGNLQSRVRTLGTGTDGTGRYYAVPPARVTRRLEFRVHIGANNNLDSVARNCSTSLGNIFGNLGGDPDYYEGYFLDPEDHATRLGPPVQTHSRGGHGIPNNPARRLLLPVAHPLCRTVHSVFLTLFADRQDGRTYRESSLPEVV
jgi:hypothetical protein